MPEGEAVDVEGNEVATVEKQRMLVMVKSVGRILQVKIGKAKEWLHRNKAKTEI